MRHNGEKRKPPRASRLAVALGVCAIVFAPTGCKEEGDDIIVVSGPDDTPDNLRGKNLVDFHASFAATDSDNQRCVECHGDMTDQVTRSATVLPFHERHEQLTPDYRCVDCHKKVDLLQGSGATLRKQVDTEEICLPCHDSSSPEPLFQP